MKLPVLRCGLLFAVSFALSAMWISLNPQDLNPRRPDEILFEGISANLAAGNGFSFDEAPPYRPEITRTPLLPALGAAVYVVTGRNRTAVLWLSAILIGIAVAASYLVARLLLEREAVAYAGAWVVCLTPQVSGAANAFLTEAPAMLQLVLVVWAVLRWPTWRQSRRAPLAAGAVGLLLASLVLNRPNLAVFVLVVAAWMAWACLRGNWHSRSSWIAVLTLGAFLGAPVLGWSARNASLGLSFTPMGVGKGAGYVYEVSRYRDILLDEGDRLPARAQRDFWSHYRRRLGPEQLIELDRENMEWFEGWVARRYGRVLAATPARLLALFSQDRISTYRQPWPYEQEKRWSAVVRWLSRLSWLLSAAGLVATWRAGRGRWIWLVAVGSTAALALISACNPRYLTPLLPLAMPYAVVLPARLWAAVHRVFPSFRSSGE